MTDPSLLSDFQARFQRRARVIRRANLARDALSGVALGAGVTLMVVACSFAWFGGRIPWLDLARSWALCLPPLFGAGVAIFRRRRRWTDEEVGLFVDAHLDSQGSVTAALAPERSSPLLDLVRRAATDALSKAPSLRPRVLQRKHLVLPAAALGLVPLLLLDPPLPSPGAEPPPGAEALSVTELEGLQPLLALEQLDALDAEHEEQLRALAEQARALQRRLANGVERREAQASLAKMQDDVDALLGEVANEANRPGLAAAIDALDRRAETKQAARALGNGDLVRFDEEMRKLSQRVERASRQAAKDALEEARKAAERHGAQALSSALEEQQRLFNQREHTRELLRQLAQLGPSKLETALEKGLSQDLNQQTAEELGDALEKALKELSDEERKLLGENLRKAVERGELQLEPGDAAQLQKLAKELQRGEAQKQMRELLKQLAKPGAAAETMQGLKRAEEGLRSAQRQAAGLLPVPQASPQAGNPAPKGGEAQTGEAAGPGRGPGVGDHEGNTPPVDGEELRARAQPQLGGSRPLLQASQGRTSARPGEVALTPDLEALSAVSAEELQGVEHSTIPEEYREQVSRYFAP